MCYQIFTLAHRRHFPIPWFWRKFWLYFCGVVLWIVFWPEHKKTKHAGENFGLPICSNIYFAWVVWLLEEKVLVRRLYASTSSLICFVFNRIIIDLPSLEICFSFKILFVFHFQRFIVFHISRYFYLTWIIKVSRKKILYFKQNFY